MKETKKIFGLLYTDCDPYAYVETYYPIATKQGRKLYYNQLKYNNLSVGYICSGQVDTAINMLQSLQIDSTKKRGVTVQFLCFCNLAHCYLYKNDLEAAQFYLSNAQPLLQKLARGNQKIYNQFLNVYHLNIHNLKLLQGEYIESRAFFEQRFQTAETNYIRIFSAYMLALLYNKTEETEKEQEAIDYIKKHGNKLIYVKLAEELEEKAIQLWKAER